MNNIITVPIEEHFAGDYRIEYDGKYITLFGKDKNYDLEGMFGAPKGTYDEMVLVSCVEEVRNANPVIEKVTDKEIIISLNVKKRKCVTCNKEAQLTYCDEYIQQSINDGTL